MVGYIGAGLVQRTVPLSEETVTIFGSTGTVAGSTFATVGAVVTFGGFGTKLLTLVPGSIAAVHAAPAIATAAKTSAERGLAAIEQLNVGISGKGADEREQAAACHGN